MESLLPKNSHLNLSQQQQSQDNIYDNDNVHNIPNYYKLLAILVHRGSLNYGHYYSFIRPDIESDIWLQFNDSNVIQVPKEYAFR